MLVPNILPAVMLNLVDDLWFNLELQVYKRLDVNKHLLDV